MLEHGSFKYNSEQDKLFDNTDVFQSVKRLTENEDSRVSEWLCNTIWAIFQLPVYHGENKLHLYIQQDDDDIRFVLDLQAELELEC